MIRVDSRIYLSQIKRDKEELANIHESKKTLE